MNFDISDVLEQWEYEPGGVSVRKFIGRDGREKLQLRVDLGLLQMNATGRPDGKQPMGCPSLLEHYLARLQQHRTARGGSDEGFTLSPEDCGNLQLEALQYHHRSICLLQLGEHAGVKRDTERNLKVFDLVSRYADSPELAWSLEQFRPQLLMLHTRALALARLQANDYGGALERIEAGLQSLREFFTECSRLDLLEESAEIMSLEAWLDELRQRRPLSPRERIEQQLEQAIEREDYEKAAQLRDRLKKMPASESQ